MASLGDWQRAHWNASLIEGKILWCVFVRRKVNSFYLCTNSAKISMLTSALLPFQGSYISRTLVIILLCKPELLLHVADDIIRSCYVVGVRMWAHWAAYARDLSSCFLFFHALCMCVYWMVSGLPYECGTEGCGLDRILTSSIQYFLSIDYPISAPEADNSRTTAAKRRWTGNEGCLIIAIKASCLHFIDWRPRGALGCVIMCVI